MLHGRSIALIAALLAAPFQAAPAAAQDHGLPAIAPSPVVPLTDAVFDSLRLDELSDLIHQEAVAEADALAGRYLSLGTGDEWRADVSNIHDPQRIAGMLTGALALELRSLDPRRLSAAAAEARRPLLAEMVARERNARRELTRPGAIDAARRDFANEADHDTDLAHRITTLIERTDPVESALAQAMNRSIAFARGFAAGGGYGFPTREDDRLADVVVTEADMRAEILSRTEAMYLIAYGDVPQSRLDEYLRWTQVPELAAVNAAVDRAVAVVCEHLSEETGLAAAARMQGQGL